jgi:catechol 2,3-dioxygenase-like lactoylglutathione lyase family enzyme
MRINTLLHAAVLVTDLERSRRFYGGVLGLKEKPRPDFGFAGAWYDLGECELHLQVTEEALPPADDRPRRDFHVALLVDDYDGTKRELESAGIEFREGTAGIPQIFIRDPDGNQVELQSRR